MNDEEYRKKKYLIYLEQKITENYMEQTDGSK